MLSQLQYSLCTTQNRIALAVAARSVDELRQVASKKAVYVIPAFETAPQQNMTRAHELADGASDLGKEQLHELVQKKLVYQFALYLFRQVRGAGRVATGWDARDADAAAPASSTWH
jgi:hypothetical protein